MTSEGRFPGSWTARLRTDASARRAGAGRTRRGDLSAASAGLVTALVAASWAPALGAQTVGGSVVDGGRWWVSLVDAADSVVAADVTAADGSFALDAPGPGRYHLRAERVGRAVHRSGAFELSREADRHEVELAPEGGEPGSLDTRASAEERCVVDPGDRTATGLAWERVRPALAIAAALPGRGDILLDVSVHRRELGPDGRSVERAEPIEVFEGVATVVPPSDPDDLVRRGFVREDEDGGYRFFAPTPAVLLSEAFHATHCSTLRAGPGTGALVGLAFEPARPDTVPDVAGVLWLDASSGAPVLLEFAYRHFDLGISLGGTGGRTAFAELPDGSWVTPETTLRMPLLNVELDPATAEPRGWTLAGVREERVRLDRARTANGTFAFTAPTGSLAGTVRLHADGPALAGAEVRLPGTPFGTRTDGSGAFRIEGLLEGTYAVTAHHPRLEALPVGVETLHVGIEEGRESGVELAALPPDEGAALLCGDADREGGRVILSGQVVDSVSAEPLAGVPLTLRFRDPRRPGAPHHESRVVSGTGGEFVYCDLPPLAEVRVRADLPGADGTRDQAFVAPAEGVVRREISVALTTVQQAGGVFGTVREHGTRRGVQAASIRIQGSPVAATTNANGFFALPDVLPGLHVLEVGALGYEGREAVVHVTGAGAVRIEIALATEPIPLEGIAVSVVPRRLFGDMVDMQRRMELGFGTFVLRDELERRGGNLSSALRGQGGILIVAASDRPGGEYAVLRGAMDLTGTTDGVGGIQYCYPAVYMDGSRISQPRAGGVGHDPVDLAIYPVGDIEAVEIYKGAGSVPGEFGGGDAACGVLVVWTRRGGASVRGSSGGGAGAASLP